MTSARETTKRGRPALVVDPLRGRRQLPFGPEAGIIAASNTERPYRDLGRIVITIGVGLATSPDTSVPAVSPHGRTLTLEFSAWAACGNLAVLEYPG